MPAQLELPMRSHGGRRAGAGRKRRSAETVPHARRPAFEGARQPLHITLRVAREVWNLRSQRGFRSVERALRAERARGALRVVHYSVQGNHLHMIVETADRETLGRRMQAFSIRFAKAVNRMMGRRRGRVIAERYHLHVLRSSREVFNAVRYVLFNHVKHVRDRIEVDPFSSAPMFLATIPGEADVCTTTPRTWLLRDGWKRYGPIAAQRQIGPG